MKILVTGGAGFVGSHAVDELVSRGHSLLVHDDLSTAELDGDGDAPRWRNSGASYSNVSFPEGNLRDVEAVLHLALRHPLERERACWGTAFQGFVVGGVRLLLELLNLRAPLKRFVLAGPLLQATVAPERIGVPRVHPEAALARGLRDLLAYWHRPPALGIYCAWFPELLGERRMTEVPAGVGTLPVERAASILADMTDGRLPHRLGQDVEVLP